MNPDLKIEIRQTLQEYFDAIPRQKEPNPPNLLDIFAKLDALPQKFDASVPGELRHYFHTKSYRKAWLYLEEN